MISQPGVEDPEAAVRDQLGHRSRERLGPARCRRPAVIASATFDQRDPAPGAWVGLSRLAFPTGAGEQMAIRRAGTEAVAISAHGERQIPPAQDGADDVSSDTLAAAGSTLIDLIVTLDESPKPRRGSRRLHPRRRQPRTRLDDRAARHLAPDRPDPDRRRHLASRASQRLADAADDPLGDRAGAAPPRRPAARLPARPRRPRPRSGLPLRPGALPAGLGRADRVRRPRGGGRPRRPARPADADAARHRAADARRRRRTDDRPVDLRDLADQPLSRAAARPRRSRLAVRAPGPPAPSGPRRSPRSPPPRSSPR